MSERKFYVIIALAGQGCQIIFLQDHLCLYKNFFVMLLFEK